MTYILVPGEIDAGVYQIGVKILDEQQTSTCNVQIKKVNPSIVLAEALTIAVLVVAAAGGETSSASSESMFTR